MESTEDDDWQNEEKSQHQMCEEHVHVEIVLERLARSPFYPAEESDAGQINRISPQQRAQSENNVEEKTQAWTNRPYVLHAGRRRRRNAITAHSSIKCSGEPKQDNVTGIL